MKKITEQQLRELIELAFGTSGEVVEELIAETGDEELRIDTGSFESCGVLTRDEGVVIEIGSQTFHITIQEV